MKKWEKLSFRRKIFAGMLFAAGIPMLIGYLVMLQIFNITYQKKLNQEANMILNATAGSLDSAFLHIYDALDLLAESEDVVEVLQTGKKDEPAVYRQLYQATSEYGSYAYFTIYDADGERLVSVSENSYIKKELPLDWGVLYEASRTPGTCIVRNARIYKGASRLEYLRVARSVSDKDGEVIGFVTAVINNDNVDHMLRGIVDENQGTIYAMDNFQEIVYCSQQTYDESELRGMRKKFTDESGRIQEKTKSYVSDDGNYFYYIQYAPKCSLYLFYEQPIAILNNIKNSVVTIAVMSGILGIIICIGLSGSLSSRIYQPVKKMQKAIAEIQDGNFEVRIKVESQDELGQLSESFNMMTEHLEENMQCLLMRERELNETHIKMMQAQLNPHFLYNTLDTLKWLGKANEIPEIATLSAGLAKILRMSISATSKIRLEQELEFAEAYVQIQRIRFEDKFEYLVEAPEELNDCIVPKLILQPLIENSIIHGFAEKDHGVVIVGAKCESERLCIVVRDNGAGMTAEQLARLNSKKPPKNRGKHSIGFYNVNEIIRLNYGEAYGLTAESEQGSGTTIFITLPVIRGEENV